RRPEIDVAPPHSIGGRALRLDDRPVLVARVAGLYRGFTHSAECDVAPNSVSGRSSRGQRSLTSVSMEWCRSAHQGGETLKPPMLSPAARHANGGRCKVAKGADEPSAPSQFSSC